MRELFATTKRRFGRIDILVNNAGATWREDDFLDLDRVLGGLVGGLDQLLSGRISYLFGGLKLPSTPRRNKDLRSRFFVFAIV